MSSKNNLYLGDAVYADYDGYHVVITTSDGTYETNRILLNPQVIQQLIDYYERLKKHEDSPNSKGKTGETE